MEQQQELSTAEKAMLFTGTGETPGKKPLPLKTNWPFPDFNKTRKAPDTKYFVDDYDGTTILDCGPHKDKAVQYIRKFGGVVRKYSPSVEERDAELSQIRANKRAGV